MFVAPLSLNTYKRVSSELPHSHWCDPSFKMNGQVGDLIWPEPGYVSPTIDSAKGLGEDQRTHRWDSCLPAQHVLPTIHFPHQIFLPSPPFSSFLLHQALTGFATHPPLIAFFIFNYHNQDGILHQKVEQHSFKNNLSMDGLNVQLSALTFELAQHTAPTNSSCLFCHAAWIIQKSIQQILQMYELFYLLLLTGRTDKIKQIKINFFNNIKSLKNLHIRVTTSFSKGIHLYSN